MLVPSRFGPQPPQPSARRERKAWSAPPFRVNRTASDRLPVYVNKLKGGSLEVTVVRKIRGNDISDPGAIAIAAASSPPLRVTTLARKINCATLSHSAVIRPQQSLHWPSPLATTSR